MTCFEKLHLFFELASFTISRRSTNGESAPPMYWSASTKRSGGARRSFQSFPPKPSIWDWSPPIWWSMQRTGKWNAVTSNPTNYRRWWKSIRCSSRLLNHANREGNCELLLTLSFSTKKWLYDISAKQTTFGKLMSDAFSGGSSSPKCYDISNECKKNCRYKNNKNGFFIFTSSDKHKCENYCIDAKISCNNGKMQDMQKNTVVQNVQATITQMEDFFIDLTMNNVWIDAWDKINCLIN